MSRIRVAPITPNEKISCPVCGSEVVAEYSIAGAETVPINYLGYEEGETFFAEDFDNAQTEYNERNLDYVICVGCRSHFSPFGYGDDFDKNGKGLSWVIECNHGDDIPCPTKPHSIRLATRMANGQPKEIEE